MTANSPHNRPDLFWLVVGLVVLAAFLSSCSAERIANRHCSKWPNKVIKDSSHTELRDSVAIRDSIVLIARDSFTIVFKDSVPCKDFEVTKQDNKGNKATVIVHNGELRVNCKCEDAKVKLQWFEHHYKQIIANYHSEVNTVSNKAGFQRFKNYYFWITAILLALFITYRILKVTGKLPISIKSG